MAKITLLVAAPADKRRLQLTVRLTAQGRIDGDALHRPGDAPWSVTWIAADGGEHVGELVRAGTGWALRENPGDDDPLWHFDARVLRPGETVTVREPDGTRTEFRVVAVEQD